MVAGTTVTVDAGWLASTTTITGQLSFSRVTNSTMTMVGGNVNVNAGGTLDMGSSNVPINVSSATLILAYGASAGQYSLTINPGGSFLVYGSTKAPSTLATATVSAGAGTVNVASTANLNWMVGDTITNDTEAVVISAINPASINFSPNVALPHYSTTPVVVADLSRNVLVRSSGTNTSANTASIQDLTASATDFNLNYGEFAYLGFASHDGITLNTAGTLGIDFQFNDPQRLLRDRYLQRVLGCTFISGE